MERKIVDYMVVMVSFRDRVTLGDTVKAHMLTGWEPLGGVCVTENYDGSDDKYCWFYQVMVKYGEV